MRPHRPQPTKLRCPWDSPGKNIGVGCHFLLQCMKVKSEREVALSCPTLSDPVDYSLPGSSIHGIFQARVLEWGAIAFSIVYLSIYLSIYIYTHTRTPISLSFPQHLLSFKGLHICLSIYFSEFKGHQGRSFHLLCSFTSCLTLQKPCDFYASVSLSVKCRRLSSQAHLTAL